MSAWKGGSVQAAATSHRERDDAYRGVLVQLSDRWRVILCKDAIQWIVQKRTARRDGWRGVSYHRTRQSLIAACARFQGALGPESIAALALLPERFGG